jgi:site-specific DNA-methyltransferase (adenine-specific)
LYSKKHSAPFPEHLAEDHIISWSNPGDLVLDPMCGSGTTLKMAKKSGRNYIGIDIAEEYCDIARLRIE